ncbi:glutaminyl-peptide cyclotransferase [Marinoscillum sp. MHG1-6]|uniref:glutaminyl-peptide cyclotransferase n=1 Tax=Marinoscillum sp. MHG1-6 TaxID=2959627 RepID=UPI0021579C40|nr:glutaminyl-peptide cyclotransferase [Marinoscillum sp. MHG1-6]
MKIWHSFIVIFIFLTGIASSCRDSESTGDSSGDSPRIIRNTKIVSPKAGTFLTIGDSIHFELSSRQTAIDSVLIEYEGEEQTFNTTAFEWRAAKQRTGAQKIRVQAFFGGESETHYPKVVFLSDVAPKKYTYSILNTYPHSKTAFTQGLFFMEDTLIESTGQRGESYIAKLNQKTGEIYQKYDMPSDYFGEGTCFWNGQIIQLTYTSQQGFVYDRQIKPIGTFNYSYEGWGITAYNDLLYITDGSHVIHLIDPRDFSEVGKIEVYNNEDKVDELNELEVINGLIYANIWRSDYVVVIEPETGRVMKEIDLSGLLTPSEYQSADVLNGIAFNPNSKELLVTGKLWPKLFEIELIEQ